MSAVAGLLLVLVNGLTVLQRLGDSLDDGHEVAQVRAEPSDIGDLEEVECLCLLRQARAGGGQ